jgi:hypothetical protein
MKTSLVRYTCVVTLGFLSANLAQAQFLRGLGDRLVDSVANRVERNVENRIVQSLEERAGQAVDQSFDAMFAGVANNSTGGDAAGRATFSKLFDTSNVKTLDEYRFDIAATFEIETLDRRGRAKRDEKAEMVFYYSADAPYTGTRMTSGAGASEGSAMIIYDFDNSLMLMLMESEGERFAMPYNWGAIMDDMDSSWTDENIEEAFPDFERIGSRRIAGYQSEGFRTRTESHVTEIWVSDEVAPGIERIFQANRAMPLLGGNLPSGYPQGMLMELNAEDLESGETVVMRTRNIETDANISFRMQDYPMLNLNLGAQP